MPHPFEHIRHWSMSCMARGLRMASACRKKLASRAVRRSLYAVGLVSASILAGTLALWVWLGIMPAPPLLEGIAFSPVVLDRHGELMRLGLTPDEKYRVHSPLHSITPDAVRAALLYEDRHFYRHPGVNPLALLRAGLSMLSGSRRMGGSTITMQVARLRTGIDTTTVSGKLEQMLLALRLERHYSKTAILEAYFSLAPYGGNVEGIGAAARVYFRKPANRLSHTESLALAVVPQNPGKRSPLSGPDFSAARVRMHGLWAERFAEQNRLPVTRDTLPPLRIHGPAALPFAAPHVAAALLAAPDVPPVLHTTLDMSLQRLLESRLAAFAARGRVYGLHNAAALLLHWPSMEIRALVGSADFHNPQISGQVDGTLARRSPGSTLKPFIYALALDQGLIHPQTLLVDSPRSFGGYDPENFDRTFRGPLPAHEALRASRNIPAISLASQLSPNLYTFLHRAGVALPYSQEHYGLSLVLGGAEVSLRELADLYAMLANRGVWRKARLLREIDAPSGSALLSPEAAVITLRMLEEPGRELRSGQQTFPLRYKTGTSNRFRDAWTAGIVGPYVLVVWVGNFDNSANPLFVGGEVAAPLFEDTARALSLHEPLADPVSRQEEGLNLVRIRTCTDTGDTDTALCPRTTETLYIPGRSPTRSSGIYRTILVDELTGLRQCRASESTREVVWEFWPTDLQALFARAGVVKSAPPPLAPECLQQTETEGAAPRILVPAEGMVYRRRVGDEARQRNAVPLTAALEADADAVFWFINDRYLGRSTSGEPLLWQPENGSHIVRVVDNRGRETSRRVLVETLQ